MKKVKNMSKNVFIIFFVLSIPLSAYAMNYIFGIGYDPSRSWVVNLGAMNHFNDELSLNIFTPASTSHSMLYDVKAYVPILGRNDLNEGFRIGPVLGAVITSQATISAGLYGQYYFGPWRFGISVMREINENNFSYAFNVWYFFSSSQYHFVDYFIANIFFDKSTPYFSLCLIEPF